MIILKNTYHKTSVNTRLKEGKNIVTRRTFNRWMRELCSDPDCPCDAMFVAEQDGDEISVTIEDHYYVRGYERVRGGAEVTIGEPIC